MSVVWSSGIRRCAKCGGELLLSRNVCTRCRVDMFKASQRHTPTARDRSGSATRPLSEGICFLSVVGFPRESSGGARVVAQAPAAPPVQMVRGAATREGAAATASAGGVATSPLTSGPAVIAAHAPPAGPVLSPAAVCPSMPAQQARSGRGTST